jgi:phosphoglycolate phosphatase-like HAD superfamily hydrolase
MRISDYSFLVFDCDGVILDSNALKTEAFRLSLPCENSGDVEKLINYHLLNGGITRQDKFEYYFQCIKGGGNLKDVNDAMDRFSRICQEVLFASNLVPGVEDFLGKCNLPSHIVTGGNQEEVRNVMKHKGLSCFFNSILGNPSSKASNMNRLKMEGRFEGRGLYFGDSQLDYDLAMTHGLDFIFISGYSDWQQGKEFCSRAGAHMVSDFSELEV